MSKEVCEWELDNENGGVIYNTNCGHAVWFDTVNTSWMFCPYCGHPIQKHRMGNL